MIFNSFDFLVFFLVVWIFQAILPHRLRNMFLLAASYLFYGCWDWRFLSLIVVSTLVDYQCSHAIAKTEDKKTRDFWLWTSCLVNLGILGFFKYANFFIDSAEELIRASGSNPEFWHLSVVLPVGISFYTFQTMSYTIDVYRGDLKPLSSLTDFALYVAFFPQLVAGPIERGSHLAPQMQSKPRVEWNDISFGAWLCLKGLFKKCVIADNMAVIVDSVYGSNEPVSGTAVLLATYAFAFQIYGDFSGYTDIARGTARTMGYDLMLNFRLPYWSKSPSEFWQRWHISLSSWLRDYLYIPLGGNRHGTAIMYRNLMITMLLGGLWHGAAWTFVLWGFYHGLLLIGYRLASFNPPKALSLGGLLSIALMFHLTCVGWMIFRAESMTQLISFSQALLTDWSFTESLQVDAWKLCLLAGPLIVWHAIEEWCQDLTIVPSLSLIPRTAIYSIMMLAIFTLGNFGGREFIYFQF